MDEAHPKIWFFAGGTFANGRINLFTRSFIGNMTERYGERFGVVEGIYHPWSFFNVLWALTWAQRPFRRPFSRPYMTRALEQITANSRDFDQSGKGEKSGVILVGSSYGSVVAAQFGCFLASLISRSTIMNPAGSSIPQQVRAKADFLNRGTLPQSFSLVLGTTVLSERSDLFLKLLAFQKQGIIREIVYHRLQDEGDNAAGLAGRSRVTAYLKALGIVFPWVTFRYRPPSFLNQHPVKGHIHQRRANSKEKAEDFMKEIDRLLN